MRKLAILLSLLFVCTTAVFATGPSGKRVFGGTHGGGNSGRTTAAEAGCSGYCYPGTRDCVGSCYCEGNLSCCEAGCSDCCNFV